MSQLSFTPSKFVILAGQVYALVTDANGNNVIMVYGGAKNATYDNCQATVTIPFYDAKKPGEQKNAFSIDADIVGTWDLYASPDWIDGTYVEVVSQATQATFDQGHPPYQDVGTHFSIKAVSTFVGYATVNSMILHYNLGEAPVG